MEKQLTQKEAVILYETKAWEKWSAEEIAKFQLFQDRLCMPFDVFHKAVEEVLGRPVWNHEFASVDDLRKEYLKERPAPSFEDIVGLLPQTAYDKAIICLVP